jgi:hypothetical protein
MDLGPEARVVLVTGTALVALRAVPTATGG